MDPRNVLNTAEVDRFLDDLARLTDRPELQSWLRSTVRLWVLKHHERCDQVIRDPMSGRPARVDAADEWDAVPRPIEDALPAWCDAALERGDTVVWLRLGPGLRKRVRRALGALERALNTEGQLALERMSFPAAEALDRAQRLADFKAARQARVEDGTVAVYRAWPKAVVARLTTADSLQDEGRRMRHCVADYSDEMLRGESRIYSLRDDQGRSRATLEVDRDGQVWQVKGFANGDVAPRFRTALQGFIRSRDFDVVLDDENLRLDPRDFRGDVEALERFLHDQNGFDFLKQHAALGGAALGVAEVLVLLRSIAANVAQLAPETRSALFAACRPGTEALFVLRPRARFWVYDHFLRLTRVELPLILLNLVRMKAFRGSAVEAEATAIYRAVEAGLTALALSRADRIYALGPMRTTETWRRDLLDSPADLLAASNFDLNATRRERHERLRRRLNRAKRRQLGRRAPSSAAHQAVRVILDSEAEDYVI